VVPVLNKLGAGVAPIRADVNAALDAQPTLGEGGEPGGAGSELVAVLRAADKEARDLNDEYVSTEHLLLALSQSKARAGDALRAAGANHDALLQALSECRGSHRVTDQHPEDKYQALEKFGRDLTEAAEQGKLDPVIGRDDEIRRVIQVLVPAHEEQPGAHRRAGRRQDRDRRGPGPAHRERRRPGIAPRPAASSRSTSAA
jgi:ATP-dependent Clp protease ATP-binding subunit ClpB